MGLLAKCNHRTNFFLKIVISPFLQNKPVSKSDVAAKQDTNGASSSSLLNENYNLDGAANCNEEGK